MLTYMLDTNICIYVMKNYPLDLRKKFNALVPLWTGSNGMSCLLW